MRLLPLAAALAVAGSALCAPLAAQAGRSPHTGPHTTIADTQPVYEDIYGHPLPPQRQTHVFGQRIAFYEMGRSLPGQPVLVLVHGYGSQADVDFGAVLPQLARHRRVIALDQIGFGNSAKPFLQYRIQTFVDFLAEFLRVQGITSFDLAGESLGGWVAAEYTIQACVARPQDLPVPKPQHLILEDAAGFTVAAAPATARRLQMSVSTLEEVRRGLTAVVADPDWVTPQIVRRRLISKMASNDGMTTASLSSEVPEKSAASAIGSRAAQITVPTLLVWGSDDHLVPIEQAHGFQQAIHGAQLVTIAKSGHVPSMEQPAAFLDAVERFLAAPVQTSTH